MRTTPTSHRLGLRKQLWLSWARLRVGLSSKKERLLWGPQVSSSTRSSSTTASNVHPLFSQTPASADHPTTQPLPRTRFILVGPVSFRSYKTEGSKRLWLWVTPRPERSWELRVVSQNYASDP